MIHEEIVYVGSEPTKNYLNMHNVTIDNREYVDKEYFKDKAIQLMNECRKDADSEDERDGIDQSIKILERL